MRIVAGTWRGRLIKAPPGDSVRPTGDRVREAWMSIVSAWLPDARVLDLFAGSGALGLEALSRGAREAHFIENAARSLDVLTKNITALGADDRAVVHRADAMTFLEKLGERYDVAFADPPYDKGLATSIAQRWLATPFADVIGIEHRRDEILPGEPDTRRYGGTCVSFYRIP